MILENESQLRDIYGFPKGRAKAKVLSVLDKHSINFIEQSPFLVLSTVNNEGQMDSSPRGGEPGFVKVLGDTEILIPDFKGNNRIDSLVNITETNQVGILIVIPGISESLRINGKAKISIEDELLNDYAQKSKKPISCIIVKIEEVFLHCAKAFMRSKLWEASTQINSAEFPSMGEMLKDQLSLSGEPETREDMVRRYQKDL